MSLYLHVAILLAMCVTRRTAVCCLATKCSDAVKHRAKQGVAARSVAELERGRDAVSGRVDREGEKGR